MPIWCGEEWNLSTHSPFSFGFPKKHAGTCRGTPVLHRLGKAGIKRHGVDCSRRAGRKLSQKKDARKASAGRDFRKGDSRSRTNMFVQRRQSPFPKSAPHFFRTSFLFNLRSPPPSFEPCPFAHDCRQPMQNREVPGVCLCVFKGIHRRKSKSVCRDSTPLFAI